MLITPVLIVGGGPVGMNLALDLAWRNLPCVLINRNKKTPNHPQGNTHNASIDTWIAVAHMGVAVAILGHGLWYQIVPQYRTNQTMPFTLLIPFFGVTLGIIILQETLTWFILAGGLITITGVSIILLGNTENKTNAVPNREIK
ncbi:MAG: EamA family transporter [Pseudomonadota bacterium]|nr:EamA family transporter [Pseudomonadota bacterium]